MLQFVICSANMKLHKIVQRKKHGAEYLLESILGRIP